MPANILMITCDQLRQDSLGCYDNPAIRTPYIDALAARGVRFDNAYTAYPVCAPNRASLVTGRYPSINGLRHNGIFLPRFELTLMEVLRQRGYQTYGAGKMHFGPQWKWPPDGGPLQDPTPALAVNPQPEPWELPWHGFDCITITEDHRVGPYEAYLNANGYDIWQDPHSFSYPQHQCVRSAWPEEHHQTTWIGDRAVEFLACHPENRPFFIWASFVHPHHPFNPPAPYDTMYAPADMPLPVFDEAEVACWPEAYRNKYFATEGGHEAIGMHLIADAEWQRIRAYYYGMISLIDKQVGRMVEMLRERKLLDNTIILFTSDHGEMLGDHHLVFKGTTYDEVTRVPLIVALPGAPRPTGARDLLVSTVDVMPTLLDLVGMPIPEGVQGLSLKGSLEDPTERVREALLIESPGVRRSVRTSDALLTWHGRGERGELYDLREDPHCLRNLWDEPQAAALQREMLARLIQLMAENVDPLPPRVGAC